MTVKTAARLYRRIWNAAAVDAAASSIVSGILKDTCDGIEVIHAPLIKSAQEKVTGAHVSMVANITSEELLRSLDDTEIANGFANRCLFVLGQRARLLPMGGRIDPDVLHLLARRVMHAIRIASQCGEVPFDDAAEALWHAVYPEVSAERPGMLGAVTARAEGQVRRLALNYTLLDYTRNTKGSEVTTQVEHLQSALAAWDYSFKSAEHMFGDMVGDAVADRILRSARDGRGGNVAVGNLTVVPARSTARSPRSNVRAMSGASSQARGGGPEAAQRRGSVLSDRGVPSFSSFLRNAQRQKAPLKTLDFVFHPVSPPYINAYKTCIIRRIARKIRSQYFSTG